ncbi:MAG: hypothetical protein M3Q17_08915 [Actinomycetota bacterium]|nr:hypothetical protein [Actinomycetota bacterium]
MPADQPDDLDVTFARIVASYDAGLERDADVPWPASEDVDESAPPPVHAATPAGPPLPLDRPFDDPLNTPASWEDEGHFRPPTPAPFPPAKRVTLLAWAGVLGAPVAFLLATLVGVLLPRLVTGVLILGFVGGVFWLIATMSRDAGDYDPDDGAVV